MLTLALLRHAKSSWDAPDLDDFERPLNARGEAAAPIMGKALADSGFRADRILCSSATRTRQTLERASKAATFLSSHGSVTFDDGLYLATPAAMLRAIASVPSDVKSLLIVGHNPGMHTLAVELAGRGSAADIGRLSDRFPTGALAVLTFEGNTWRDVRVGEGRLEAFLTPRSLG